MADDASYNTFLTKANQPTAPEDSSQDQSTSQGHSRYDPTLTKTSSGGNDPEILPASLRDVGNETYISDTDEAFEPVFLNYSGDDLPGLEDFIKVLGTKGDQAQVEELSVKDFDPRGQYKSVIQKVEQAGREGAGVKVYRVEISRTRCEYFVVTLGKDGHGGKLVGVAVKAVES